VTVGDTAALIVASASVAAVAALLYAVLAVNRTLRELRTTLDEVRAEALPVVAELRATAREANNEIARIDGVIGTASTISATVDSASKLAYAAFSNPVIKTMALASGTSKAAKRLRRGSANGNGKRKR
jgi:ABC-type transporter Mla subunit MlaD